MTKEELADNIRARRISAKHAESKAHLAVSEAERERYKVNALEATYLAFYSTTLDSQSPAPHRLKIEIEAS